MVSFIKNIFLLFVVLIYIAEVCDPAEWRVSSTIMTLMLVIVG